MKKMVPLSEIAKVIRSKNAGPFEITMDIIFNNQEEYQRAKATGVITKELIASLYNLPVEKIITFVEFDAANAIKATIPRIRPQGSIGETDTFAAQQHAPLLSIMLPWED
jgi:hypothetical protein